MEDITMSPIRLRKFRNQPVTAARFIRSVKHHFVENISVPHRVKPRQVLAILNDILEPLPGSFEETSAAKYSHTERFVHKALRILAGLRVLKLYPWMLSSVYTFAYFLISRREKDTICMKAYDCIRKGETLNTTIVRHIVNSVIFGYDNESKNDDDESREALSENIESFRRSLQSNYCKKELQVLAEWPKGLGLMCSIDEYENMENEMRHFFKLFEMNNSISSDSIEDDCKSITSKSSQHIDKNLGNRSSENKNEVEIEEIFSMNPQHESNNNLNLIRLNTSCMERKHIEECKRNNNNLRTRRYKNETWKKLDALKNKKKNTREKLRKKMIKKVLLLKEDSKSIADKSNNLENRRTEESSINESNLRLESNTNNELHKVEMIERRKKKKKMIIKDLIADRTRSKNKISLKKLDTVDQELKDKSGEVIENNNVANDDEFTCKRIIPFVGKTVQKPLYGGPERPIEVDCSVSDTICSSEYLNKKLPGLSSQVNVIVDTSNNREQDSTSSQDAERQTDVLSKLSSSKNVNEQLSSSSCVNDTDHLKKASAKLLNNKMYTNKRKFNAYLGKDHTNIIETNNVVTSESVVAALTMSKEKQDNHIAVNQNSAKIISSNSSSDSLVMEIPVSVATLNTNLTAEDNDIEVEIVEIRKSNTSSTSIPRSEMENDSTSAHSFTPEPLKISNHEQSQLQLAENTDDKFSTKRTSSVCQSEESSRNEPQKRLNSATKQKQDTINEQASLTGSTSKRTSIAEEDVEIEPSLSNSKKMKQQPLLQPNVKIISSNSSSDSLVMEIPVSVATLNTNLTAEDNDIEVEIVEIRKSNISSKSIPEIKTSNDTASAHARPGPPPPYPGLSIASNKPSSSQVPNYFVQRGPPPLYSGLSIASNKPSSSQVPRDLTVSKTFQTNILLPTPSKNMSTDINLPAKPAVNVYSNKSRTKPRIIRNVRISPQQQSNFQFNAKRYSSHLSVVRHSSTANITSTSSNCLQSQEQQQSVSQGKPQQNHHLHQQIQWQQQQQRYGTNEVVILVPNDWQSVDNPKKCYVCDYCPDQLIFESEGLLRKHMDVTHNYSCELCQYRYPSLQELLQHIGVHLGVLI